MSLPQTLAQVVERLRGPDGCPWDREQTPATLAPFLVEETAELLDALASGDAEHIEEELGDVMLLVQLLGAALATDGVTTPQAAEQAAVRKMIARHPHVFGTGPKRSWQELKAEERAPPHNPVDAVPRSLPALAAAAALGQVASGVGFDWPDAAGPRRKIEEELGELDEAVATGVADRIEAELGDVLFSVVNLARHVGVDPDRALRRTSATFRRRFRYVVQGVVDRGQRVQDVGLDALDALWRAAKESEPCS